MIQFYARDAAVVIDALNLVANFKQAADGGEAVRGGPTYQKALGNAQGELTKWTPADIVEADPQKKQAVVAARLESIIAAITDQRDH
jgi:hypothetical protein